MRARIAGVVVVLLAVSSGCARRVPVPIPGADGKPVEEVPEGKVALTVVSADPRVWDLRVKGDVVCHTPCSGHLDAYDSFAVESDANEGIFVHALTPEAIDARRALVIAEGRNEAKYVNGVVFTSLGGMAGVVAITLAAVGCSDLEDRRGMCHAGLITGAVAVPLTAFSIWLLTDSVPKVHIVPTPAAAGSGAKPTGSVLLTPVGVAGTF